MVTRGWKAWFAFLAFAPIPLFAAGLAADAAWNEPGEPGAPAAAFLPLAAAIACWAVGVTRGLVFLERREGLARGERRSWEAMLLFLFPVSLPVLWWTQIRPLAEGAPRTSAPTGLEPAPGQQRRRSMVSTPDKLLATWILGVPLAAILALAIYIAVVNLT